LPDKSFLVFEGGEGAGKTTSMAALAARLQQDGHDVLLTREPGGTPEGMALRGLLLSTEGPAWDRGAELLLMVAARVQHVKTLIRPALRAGKTVLCDRFVGSTLAYQGAGHGLPKDLILDLHRRLVGDLWPDLTILLDVDPRIGLARSAGRLRRDRLDEGRFETLDLAFHDRVRAAFLAQAAERPTLVIDAGLDLPQVHADLLRQVTLFLAR
jgi:dTMP kinase